MQIGSYICVEIGDKSIENKKKPTRYQQLFITMIQFLLMFK